MVQHARANDLIECLAEFADALDLKSMEIEIAKTMLFLKTARMAQTGFTDVDRRHMSVRLGERILCGLRRPATGDQDLSVWPRLLQRPQQKRLRPAPMRVGIAIAAWRKIADRRGIRVGIVKRANRFGTIGRRWIAPMTATEVSANLVFQSQFQDLPKSGQI